MSRSVSQTDCDACNVALKGNVIGPHVIAKCPSCSSLILLTTEAVPTGYEQISGHLYDTCLHAYRLRQAKRHLRYLHAVTNGRRILDVGAGRGTFVQVARSQGWEAYGIEQDAESVAKAESPFVSTGGIASFAPASFDVVTLFDVLEHVWDRSPLLSELDRVLKPGGLMMIRVPNGLEFVTRAKYELDRALGRSSSSALFGEHKAYLTRLGLERLLERSGFAVVKTWYEHEAIAVTEHTGLKGMAARAALYLIRLVEQFVPPSRTEVVVVCTKMN